MYCEDYKKLIFEYFDTGLVGDEKALLEEHLAVCNSCQKEFEEFQKLFSLLEKDNEIVQNQSEEFIQTINVEEIVSKIKKKKWFEFQFKPSFAFAVILMISLIAYFNLTSVKNINNEKIAKQENLNEVNTTDFLTDYINQNYIYENIDLTALPQSDYFKDVVNFIDELNFSFISNENLISVSNPALNDLDEKAMDEIIAQLENKKFLGE